jgi:hypothetical protein
MGARLWDAGAERPAGDPQLQLHRPGARHPLVSAELIVAREGWLFDRRLGANGTYDAMFAVVPTVALPLSPTAYQARGKVVLRRVVSVDTNAARSRCRPCTPSVAPARALPS